MLRRPPRVTLAPTAHPLVQELFREMYVQQIGVVELANRAGVNKNTLKDWRTRTTPNIKDLIACFNVLGLDLVIRKQRDPYASPRVTTIQALNVTHSNSR